MRNIKEFISSEFEKFFEFDAENKGMITSVSCRLFTNHVVCAVLASQAKQPESNPLQLLNDFQELNMGNYGNDDVRRLNNWAIDAYAVLQSQAQQKACPWISVDERLPALGEKVLGIYNDGICAFMRVCAGDDNWNWAIGRNNFYDDVFYDDDDDYQVTDWTPLPQNLKKGKNE